jgi:N-acetyl-anhydromuramyl-L-alanine amidase AmpD
VDESAARAAGVDFAAFDNMGLSAHYHVKSLKEIEQLLG